MTDSLTAAKATTTRPQLMTVRAFELKAGDTVLFPSLGADGLPYDPAGNPLAIVVAVGASADPYLDDAEPITLITEDEHGSHLIDHVEPMRRFHICRETDWLAYPGGDFVD